MKTWKKTFLFSALALGFSASASANLTPFDITINFESGLSAGQQDAFVDAENFWESAITGYADAIDFTPGLTITARGESIDGQGGVLGSAGPVTGFYNTAGNSLLYASTGTMRFDTADLSNMESNGSLLNVIIHEMAHVIGFGTLWELNGLYSPGTGQYIGQHAIDAYQQEFDASATTVPVELDGGPGTADGHWDETWAGPTSDIMTGYIEGAVTISDTTYAAFRDLGYATSNSTSGNAGGAGNSSSNDVPVMFFGGLALLGMAGVRRRK
jgi:hypothetical protein